MEFTQNPDKLAEGRFCPKIAKIFPFEQTVEAYKYLESNAQIGNREQTDCGIAHDLRGSGGDHEGRS